MYCKHCGTQLPDQTKFCADCGMPTDDLPRQPATSPRSKNRFNIANYLVAFIIVALILFLAFFCIIYLPKFLEIPPSPSPSDTQGTTVDPTPTSTPTSTPSVEEASEPEPLPGNPIITYNDCLIRYDSYVLANSNASYKCYADISGLSKAEIRIAQEEIYARHGATFTDPDLQAYFTARTWYTPGSGEITLNSYEEANLCLLRVYIALQDGTLYDSDNPYLAQVMEDYAAPESNIRNLRAADLKDLTKEQLTVARNEILARYGYVFTSQNLQEYFYSKPWYRPTAPRAEFNTGVLSKAENQNITMIQLYEKRATGVSFSSGNPYASIYNSNRLYIYPYSDTIQLQDSDRAGKTKAELTLAYHEIYARHGFTFSDEHLLEYFLQFPWYAPDTLPGDSSTILFSHIEDYNLRLLKKWQSAPENTNTTDVVSYDKYTYTIEKNGKVLRCYHIPHVDMPGITDSLNQRMYNVHYANIREHALSDPEQPMLLGVLYTVGRYQDIISVLVIEDYDWDLTRYSVYHFSTSTGTMLTDAQVFAAFGMTEQDARNQIRTSLAMYWDDQITKLPAEYKSSLDELKIATLQDSNINRVKPYIDSNGNLRYTGAIYSPAGADSYEHLFDAFGNLITHSCKVHP